MIARILIGLALAWALRGNCLAQSLRVSRPYGDSRSFQLEVRGPLGLYHLEVSDDLKTWRVEDSDLTPGTTNWLQLVAMQFESRARFYRMVMIGASPQILTQPKGVTIEEGQAFTLTVAASGDGPLSYQWFRAGAPLSGAIGASYQRTNATAAAAGSYYAYVTSAKGAKVVSATAVVVVNPKTIPPPTITQHPASLTVQEGQAFTLMVTATGTAPLRYQWLASGKVIAGATNATLNIANASLAAAGLYTVTVTTGAVTISSQAAIVTVTPKAPPAPPVISRQPVGVSVQEGQAFTLTVTASGAAPLSYQWLLNGRAVVGASAATLTVASATTASAGSYTVIVTTGAGGSTTSQAAIVTVTPKAVVIGPASLAGLTIRVSAAVAGPYRWITSTAGGKYVVFPDSGQNGSRGTYTFTRTVADRAAITLQDYVQGTMSGTVTFTSATGGTVSLGVFSGPFTIEATTMENTTLAPSTVAGRTIRAAIFDGRGLLSPVGGWRAVIDGSGTRYSLTSIGFIGNSAGTVAYSRGGNTLSFLNLTDSLVGALLGTVTWYSPNYGEIAFAGGGGNFQNVVFKLE
jgi:hypothetical protein